MSDEDELELWISQHFTGQGVAIRREEESPIPGEPFMSMMDAKNLTRRAVKVFGTDRISAIEQHNTTLMKTTEELNEWAGQVDINLAAAKKRITMLEDCLRFYAPHHAALKDEQI